MAAAGAGWAAVREIPFHRMPSSTPWWKIRTPRSLDPGRTNRTGTSPLQYLPEGS